MFRLGILYLGHSHITNNHKTCNIEYSTNQVNDGPEIPIHLYTSTHIEDGFFTHMEDEEGRGNDPIEIKFLVIIDLFLDIFGLGYGVCDAFVG